jgi:hypothetical protein
MGLNGISVLYAVYDEWLPNSEGLNMADTQPHYDDEDVPAALARTTQDGSGFKSESELPESDFVSFTTDDVELVEDDEDEEGAQ